MAYTKRSKKLSGFFIVLVAAGFLVATFIFRPAQIAHAFPTNTTEIDNFNRANGAVNGSTSSSGPTWASGGLFFSNCNLNITTNQITSSSGFCSSYLSSGYGPDTEVYATVSTVGSTSGAEILGLVARITNPTTSSISGYMLEIHEGTNGSWHFVKIDNNTQSTLATVNQTVSNGGKVGFLVTGTTDPVLSAWYNSGASWVQVGSSFTDTGAAAKYLGSGQIGLEIATTLPRIDDFGGGTVITNNAPAAPTLIQPADTATGISESPRFTLRTTDAESDYLRYKIEVCSTSNCSAIVRTIDQTAAQTGWASQDTQSATAYTAGTVIGDSRIAEHFYQNPALSPSTQYWWRAYAIDPGGTNTFSSASSIFSFTTGTQEIRIQGGIEIRGGTTIQQ